MGLGPTRGCNKCLFFSVTYLDFPGYFLNTKFMPRHQKPDPENTGAHVQRGETCTAATPLLTMHSPTRPLSFCV